MLKRLAPEPAKKYSKKRVLYNKIDFALGKKFYGSSVGFMNNFKNGKDVLTKSNEKIKNTNPELYYLIKNGFTSFPSQYDESLIKNIQKKYQILINDDDHSFTHSKSKESDFGRMIRDPSIIFPELSQLITNDVLALVGEYYNTNFIISNIQCARNYHVPIEIRKKFETFSNFWHQDKDPISQCKYFVYLSDVSEPDGPFNVLTKKRTKQLINSGYGNRDNNKISQEILEDPNNLTKMMGPAGTSFFGCPPLCLHRAGDPEKGHFRDMVQFTFKSSDSPLPKNWIDMCPGTPLNIVPRTYEK